MVKDLHQQVDGRETTKKKMKINYQFNKTTTTTVKMKQNPICYLEDIIIYDFSFIYF